MFDDVFVERFVKREKTAANSLFTVLSITATVSIIGMINIVPILFGLNIIMITGMLSVGIGILCYFINKRMNVEYEISLTNDIFNVSRILGESKRDLLADFVLKECKRIAPVTSEYFEEDYNSADFELNATALKNFEISDKNWYCLVAQERITYIVIFEFVPKMYKAFRKYNPRYTHVMPPPKETEE